jgi:hypothetical protein
MLFVEANLIIGLKFFLFRIQSDTIPSYYYRYYPPLYSQRAMGLTVLGDGPVFEQEPNGRAAADPGQQRLVVLHTGQSELSQRPRSRRWFQPGGTTTTTTTSRQ